MSTTELDFPPVDEAMIAKAAKTAAAVAVVPGEPITDLAKLDLTTVALAQYGDWRTALAATKANLSTLVLDLSTPTKIKEARTLRARLIGDPLAAVRKVAAGIKSKMAQTSKALGAELELIEAGYTEADALILPQIEKREAELDAEREAARKAEAERKAGFEAKIDGIRACVARCEGIGSDRIANGIAQIEVFPLPTAEEWQEYAVPAANAICETLEAMRKMLAKAMADEAAERQREADRIEATRVRLENEILRQQLAAAEGAFRSASAITIEHTQQGANRDASAEQSHVAEGSASPTGQGADGPTACGAAPVLSSFAHVEPPAGHVEPESVLTTSHKPGDPVATVSLAAPGPITMVEPADPVKGDVAVVATAPIPVIDPAAPAAPVVDPVWGIRATVTLSEINARLGFDMTSAFLIETLGIKPGDKVRNAFPFYVKDWPAIKAALIAHLEALA